MSQFSLYETKVLGKRKCHWSRIRINEFIQKICTGDLSTTFVIFFPNIKYELLKKKSSFLFLEFLCASYIAHQRLLVMTVTALHSAVY